MKVADVCAVVDQLAPPGFAYDWDRSGLSIGDPTAPVSKVLVALSVSRDVYRVALKAGVQLIVSHHPVMWAPLAVLRTDDPTTRLRLDLASSKIACYAAHTNLDVVRGGVSDVLARQLALQDIRPLIPTPTAAQLKLVTFVPESHLVPVRRAVCEAGAGIIGEYRYCSFSAPGVGTFVPGDKAQPFSGKKHRLNEEVERRFEVLVPKARLDMVLTALRAAHPYDEPAYDLVCLENRDSAIGLGARGVLAAPTTLERFARDVCRALALDHLRMVGDPRRKVRTVAVLGGSGGGEIDKIPSDIDVYVTGDIRYHDAQTALERGLAILDAGHLGTEKGIVPVLARYLRSNLRTVKVMSYAEPEMFRVVKR